MKSEKWLATCRPFSQLPDDKLRIDVTWPDHVLFRTGSSAVSEVVHAMKLVALQTTSFSHREHEL